MSAIRVKAEAFSCAKQGHPASANEDAWAGPVLVDEGARMAVADGATESAYSGLWARLLAAEAVRDGLSQAVDRARARFDESTAKDGTPRPWYADAKIEEGAFAAVLVVTARDDGTWQAEAIGDCVVLQVRDERVVRAWPIDDAAAFDSRPALVSSRGDAPLPEILMITEDWIQGDVLVAVTDALAEFLLRHPPEIEVLFKMDGQTFVKRARREGMRNDDVTFVMLRLEYS